MGWTHSLNAALQRLTGARLTRESLEARDRAVTRAARVSAREARQATAERYQRRLETLKDKHARQLRQRDEQRRARDANKQRERAEREARGEDLPAYYDDRIRDIIAAVRPRTMTNAPKLQSLVEATRYVSRHRIPGDIVECGVWRGGSMQAIALALAALGDTERELHLFDTFEGMTAPTEHDVRARDGEPASELLATHGKDARIWAYADLDDVRSGMAEVAYPADLIHYHPGLVEDTIPQRAPATIALLRLDTDWYESTKHELEHLYDRLSPGGILILDDYGDWEGARKATEEWLAATGTQLFLAPMGSGRIAVKPLGP